MNNVNLKNGQKGVSGFQFLGVMAGFLTVFFCLGLFLAPDTVKAQLASDMGSYLLKLLVKIIILTIWSGAVMWVIFYHVLDTTFAELREYLEQVHNDSHAIIAGAIILAGGLIIGLSQGVTVNAFAYTVLTKGSVGVAIATIFTIVGAWRFGVRSMDGFRDWIGAESNDSHAILVSSMWLAIIILAMTF